MNLTSRLECWRFVQLSESVLRYVPSNSLQVSHRELGSEAITDMVYERLNKVYTTEITTFLMAAEGIPDAASLHGRMSEKRALDNLSSGGNFALLTL